jgi:hypothetical protein
MGDLKTVSVGGQHDSSAKYMYFTWTGNYINGLVMNMETNGMPVRQ